MAELERQIGRSPTTVLRLLGVDFLDSWARTQRTRQTNKQLSLAGPKPPIGHVARWFYYWLKLITSVYIYTYYIYIYIVAHCPRTTFGPFGSSHPLKHSRIYRVVFKHALDGQLEEACRVLPKVTG